MLLLFAHTGLRKDVRIFYVAAHKNFQFESLINRLRLVDAYTRVRD